MDTNSAEPVAPCRLVPARVMRCARCGTPSIQPHSTVWISTDTPRAAER